MSSRSQITWHRGGTAGNVKFPSSPYASSGGRWNRARSPTRIARRHRAIPAWCLSRDRGFAA
eukprot:31232-Pelagococcus_subviridis.AAC.8